MQSCSLSECMVFSSHNRNIPLADKDLHDKILWPASDINAVFLMASGCLLMHACISTSKPSRKYTWKSHCPFTLLVHRMAYSLLSLGGM